MPSLKRGNKTRVVSVREKVIDHLKTVQSRLINAPQAEVALEYCIKMIANNELNEQDLDWNEKAGPDSISEESEEHSNKD